MSRMILSSCLLVICSGCWFSASRELSLAQARLETSVPSWSLFEGPEGCSDCIPPMPLTNGYHYKVDYHRTRHTAHNCAMRDLQDYQCECGQKASYHFRNGFIAAYEDLALNRKPSPPVVPPPVYWNAYYRSCAGKPSVDEWFAGYDMGRDRGLNSGVSKFNEISLRRNGCDIQQTAAYGDEAYDGYDAGQTPPFAPGQSEAPQAPLTPIPQAASSNFHPYHQQGRY